MPEDDGTLLAATSRCPKSRCDWYRLRLLWKASFLSLTCSRQYDGQHIGRGEQAHRWSSLVGHARPCGQRCCESCDAASAVHTAQDGCGGGGGVCVCVCVWHRRVATGSGAISCA